MHKARASRLRKTSYGGLAEGGRYRGSGGDEGGFLEGGLVGVGDGVFGAAEAGGEGGELGPFGAFEGEEDFVEIAIAVFTAAEGGFDFGIDGQGAEDFLDGLIEQGIGDGEESHEEENGTFFVKAGGGGKILAEIGAGERGTD